VTEPFQTPSDKLLDPEKQPEFRLTSENWAFVERGPRERKQPREKALGPWAVWREEGAVYEVEDVADHFGVTAEDVIRRLSEDGAGATGGGDAGDTGVGTVSFDELDTDPGEDGVRKTVRKLDQGAIDFIREVTGASSDAEAVRMAIVLAEQVLVEG